MDRGGEPVNRFGPHGPFGGAGIQPGASWMFGRKMASCAIEELSIIYYIAIS